VRGPVALCLLMTSLALASCSSPARPWSEDLTWTGTVSGSLTQARGTCYLHSGLVRVIYLHSSDGRIEVTIPRRAHGSYKETLVDPAGSVILHIDEGGLGSSSPRSGLASPDGDVGLFIAASGSVTYGSNGNAGSMDVWLSQQLANMMGPASVHLSGTWSCQ
jgi:hypothetical protein